MPRRGPDDHRRPRRGEALRSPALERQGVTSAVNVLIGQGSLKYGVLGAYSREQRSFTLDDANFLQAVGHVLGSAIERRRSEDRARHDALHDPLTGLPNRALLLDRLEHALAAAARTGRTSPCCSSTSTTSR